jgi:hypothetical protein
MSVALYNFGLRTLRSVTQRLVNFFARDLVYTNRAGHFVPWNKRKKKIGQVPALK